MFCFRHTYRRSILQNAEYSLTSKLIHGTRLATANYANLITFVWVSKYKILLMPVATAGMFTFIRKCNYSYLEKRKLSVIATTFSLIISYWKIFNWVVKSRNHQRSVFRCSIRFWFHYNIKVTPLPATALYWLSAA